MKNATTETTGRLRTAQKCICATMSLRARLPKAKRIAATAPTQIIAARPTSARMSKTRRPSRWTAERAGSRTGGSRTIIEG